ncbi:MAG: T9SS type A sorting domain-containing protein, partial [Saprospiraceae bacterium]|nr:T9SS type A sorting domain-containing protein [Saprospiraceae bacterium]
WAGVAVQEACAGPTDHTWAHEMGHALSVQHPFLGWEGGVGHDGSNTHDFSNPAPEFVTYNYTNFKDSLILDTIIVDTIMVEKMDGSNCHEAADGFCDTAPDYIALRWACTPDSVGFVQQTDPNGETFYSDGTLIMSYSFSNCKGRFSGEQIAAMRANSLDEKGDISSVGMEITPPDDAGDIQLMSPDQDELVYYRDVEFAWSESNEDNYYLLQIGVEPSFSLVLFDTIVSQSSMVLREADSSWGNLYWRVRPFTADEFCTEYSVSGIFEPTETSAVSDLASDILELYPNVLTADQSEIFIKTNSHKQSMNFTIYNVQGMIVERGSSDNNRIKLNSSFPGSGMYFISLETNSGVVVRKLYVN